MLKEEFLEPMGISQGELAKAMGVGRKTVNELCGGRRGMTAETNFLLANVWSSSGLPASPLFTNKLYEAHSHLGVRNFVTYGYRAANETNSKAIKRQLKPLWKRLNDEISRK
jgi:transcriptional regulator with XRE-family HTH domain